MLKGEINEVDAFEIFQADFDDALCEYEDEDIKDKKFASGLDYFAELMDRYKEWRSGVEILGVEEKELFKVGGYDFIGFIDLLYKDEDGNLIICDHKSAQSPLGKKGNVLKSKEQKMLSYRRQLELYAKPVLEKYGKVDFLEWNFFGSQQIYRIPFNKKEYQETLKWAQDMIETIAEDEDFVAKKQFFYCRNLCNYRNSCDERFED